MKKAGLSVFLIIFAATSLFPRKSDFPKLSGPYLGQKPPGMTPEVFAPGVIPIGEYPYGVASS